MSNDNPLSYTGKVPASTTRLGVAEFNSGDFSVAEDGVVSLAAGLTPTSITASGDITTSGGNVIISGAGKQLRVEGGAVTDFIGRATLAAGTVTVANTNIAAGDRIFVTRSDPSTSTALGVFRTSISAGASFTITALNPTDATTQENDVSVVDYFIVRQL